MAKAEKAKVAVGSTMNFEETLRAIPIFFENNIVPLLVAETGVGKTQLFEQYTASNNMDYIPLYVSQLEPSDFVGLYQTTEDGRTRNCPPNWLPYKDVKTAAKADAAEKVAKLLADMTGVIKPNGGVIFLDEINRGHEDIRQALYQFINTGRIHTYCKPANYKIAAAANPGKGYEVYDFDPALINRFAWVRFLPDSKETFSYLTKKYGINPVTEWLKSDPALMELGDGDLPIDGMRLSPRMTENCIKVWLTLEKNNEKKEFSRKILETMVVPEKVQSFLSFQEELKHCTWQEVLSGKKKDRVKELVTAKRLDVLSTLTNYLGEVFGTYEIGKTERDEIPRDKEKDAVKNLVDFLVAIPDELTCAFVDMIPRTRFTDPKCIVNDKTFREALKPKLVQYARLFKDKV